MSAPATPPSFEPSFAAALLDPGLPVPHGIVSDNAAGVNRRFAVHRNNAVAGLVEALEARFPAVAKIVGKEFFVAMARAYVQERPPRSPLLAAYGDEFADFIGAFEPAHELPYLADVARTEAARTRAYHAADAAPLGAGELAQLDAKALSGLRVDLHPSLQIVRSAHPVVTIWAMNSGAQKLKPIEAWNAEDALIVRPYLDVEVRLLPPGCAAFLHALAEGRSVGAAADAALVDNAAFDLTGSLAALIGWGLASGCTASKPNERGTSNEQGTS
jgi:Putative DNA-binding domain